MSLNLILFDVDGTLTKSNDVDTECFKATIKQTLHIESINTDWSSYKYVTDSGVTTEIFEQYYNRKPRPEELDSIKQIYLKNLKQVILTSKIRCTEISGALTAFNRLKNDKNFAIAFSTGCWKKSAEIKLKNAEFNYSDIPFASADDSIEREKIMLLAVERARQKYNVQNFKSHIYIGDGIWDFIAAHNLNFDFIGISEDNNKQRLIDAGAKFVLPDFLDFDKFYNILN